ncbi:MAG TPA: M23 family metallopeptidase [Gemmatimonadaceae bacterium]|nr:M23 family metallopeptidase [Gemmatimonadaceae bacterium]
MKLSAPSFVRSLAPLVVLLAACRAGERLTERFQPRTPHEKYAAALADAGLDRTVLGRRWLDAAQQSLRTPATVSLPFQEAGYFGEADAAAVAYQFAARRGQRVVAELTTESAGHAAVFVDVFAPPADSAGAPRGLTSADSLARGGTVRLDFEPEQDGSYVLRLQPELLRGVRYHITVRAEASLAFPVSGRDSRAVRSGWGAERDGGRRSHQGVDIFAPRGTPVLAAADGWVRNVGITTLGGKVVWVSDPLRGQSLYYAHLDSQIARVGDRVKIGDTLGLVGNSGNARTTPPHLHFGIYRRGWGAIDPFPFVHTPRDLVPRLTADTGALGSWRRTDSRVALLSAPAAGTSVATVAQLAPRTPLRIIAAAAGAYRAELPDGRVGYVRATATEPAATPLSTVRPAQATALLDHPSPRGVTIDSVAARVALLVLGRYGDYALVRTEGGRLGWLQQQQAPVSTVAHSPSPTRRRAAGD